MKKALTLLAIPAILLSCSGNTPPASQKFAVTAGTPFAATASEPRLTNIRMLTNGGENAEAYFSGDETKLIFQRTRPPELPCDQIFTYDLRTGEEKLVSTGKGRTTCGYFYPSDKKITYASTHHVNTACPAPPDMRQGYVWALYDYDIFAANADGSGVTQLTENAPCNWSPRWSPDGARLAFPDGTNSYLLTLDQPMGTRKAEPLPRVDDAGAFMVSSWSPNDRALAGMVYRRDGSQVPGIVLYWLESKKYQRLTDFGFGAVWMSDSRRLLIGGREEDALDPSKRKLLLLDTVSGKSVPLLDVPARTARGKFGISRDDRTIFFVEDHTEADVWQMTLQRPPKTD